MEHKKRQPRLAFGEHFGQLITDTLGGNLADLRSQLLDGVHCAHFQDVAETGGKAHSPKHAEFVFTKTFFRIANRADNPGFEIFLPANIIQDFVRQGIEQQAVDGEVTALYIFLRSFTEADFIRVTTIGIADIAAESSDLDGLVFTNRYQHDAELCADTIGFGKDTHYVFRERIGGDVVVARFPVKKQIPDTPAD